MMRVKCPYCGHEIQKTNTCSSCHQSVSWVRQFVKKSNVYYNAGYEAAKSRQLSLAVCYLQKALNCNKYHKEARNLLGLIYYEIGQVGDALKEWIISQSLQKEDNIATTYIQQIQKEPRIFERYEAAIRLYNEALQYAKEKNKDMAVIRLRKAVSYSPHLICARALLGLYAMNDRKMNEARKIVEKILSIDAGHLEALTYERYLNKNKKGSEKVTSSSKSEPTRFYRPVVIGNGNSEHTFIHYILHFLLGAGIVFGLYTYLIMPAKVKDYQNQVLELQTTQSELQQKLQKLTNDYQGQIATLTKDKEALEHKSTTYENEVSQLAQKQKLTDAKNFQQEGNYEEAAKCIYQIASTKLDDQDRQVYDDLKESVYPEAATRLYNQAIGFYERGAYFDAIQVFENLLLYEPKERTARKALYYLGCSEMENGSSAQAEGYFRQLITDYEGSYEAGLAEGKLEEMQ